MADVIDYKIYGNDMQMVEIELDPQEAVQAEAGAMMYMENGINMQTGTGNKGLFGGLKRMLTGESFFITNFYNTAHHKSHVAFAAPYPGKIIPIDLKQHNNTFICQKDAYLCSAKGVDIEVAFTKRIGAGFFGGEGFIMQRLIGDGMAFIHAGGEVIKKELVAGETLKVDTGCFVAASNTVDYNVEFVGGFKNALFGGEGLFFATLTGPGIVYLQTLPFSRLADRLSAGFRRNKGEQRNSLLGSLLGD